MGNTKCRIQYIAQCNKRCQPKRKPQPKARPQLKRKPVPKRKPQPKKIGKCDCRALAVQKCGSRGTNRQTKCRNDYIANVTKDVNQKESLNQKENLNQKRLENV